AVAARRGSRSHVTSARPGVVSDHTAASTPATAAGSSPGTTASGSQPSARGAGTCPAQSRPSGEPASYLMSWYACSAGESTTRAPAAAARATSPRSGRVSHTWTTEPGVSGALAASCHATTVRPARSTTSAAVRTRRAYSSGSIVSTSSPPTWTYRPG